MRTEKENVFFKKNLTILAESRKRDGERSTGQSREIDLEVEAAEFVEMKERKRKGENKPRPCKPRGKTNNPSGKVAILSAIQGDGV